MFLVKSQKEERRVDSTKKPFPIPEKKVKVTQLQENLGRTRLPAIRRVQH